MKHTVRNVALGVATIPLLLAQSTAASSAQDAAAASEQSLYSCEEAIRLKGSAEEFNNLSPDAKFEIYVTALHCDAAVATKLANEAGKADEAPTAVVAKAEDGKVFFGIVKASDLARAKQTCGTAAAYTGIAITVSATFTPGAAAAAEAGQMVFEYGNVACNALGDALANENPLLVLSPGIVVGSAVVGQSIINITADLGIRGEVGGALNRLGNTVKSVPDKIDKNLDNAIDYVFGSGGLF